MAFQRAGEVARAALTSSPKVAEKRSSRVEPLPEKAVSQLFVRLTSIYPHRWASQFRSAEMLEAAKREWAFELGEFSREDIGRALHMAKRQYIDWPPTLPQFRALCRQYASAAHRPFDKAKALTKKPDPAVGKRAVREMMKVCGKRHA